MIPARAAEIADAVRGTCKALYQVESKDFDDAGEELMQVKGLPEAFDALVMCCEECEWWVDTHEISDRQFCHECEDNSDTE